MNLIKIKIKKFNNQTCQNIDLFLYIKNFCYKIWLLLL